MEGKREDGWLSRVSKIFKKGNTPDEQTTPLIKEQPPQTKPVEEPPLMSGEEIRIQKMKERTKNLQQGGLAADIENAQNALNRKKNLSKTKPPKETEAEYFRRLTNNPPKPTVPPIYAPNPVSTKPEESVVKPDISPVETLAPEPVLTPSVTSPPPENSPVQPTEPSLSKKKERRLDPVAVRASLKNAGWGTKSPTPPPVQPKPLTSVSPFEPGSVPGVDKWQPGKGGISNEAAMKIRDEVKKMPDSHFGGDAEPIKKESVPVQTPTPQEKVKEPA